MINFGLAREIYGMSPWYVDQETLPSLLSILDNNLQLEIPEVKYNTPHYLVSNGAKLISRPWQLSNDDEFTGIGIININGPITRSGGASSVGMEDLSHMMLRMAKDERIVSFIVRADSGGGSSSAVEVMADVIKEVDQTKPVYGHIVKGGMAASACFGILSACRAIYAESTMSMVGSAGTMIQFEGREANSEVEGKKHIRLYASKSIRKNEEFEAALNNDNYELIINNILDPMNENFLNLIQTNRPILKGTDFDNGKCIYTKDAVGTFIDGIKTFAEVVEIAEAGTFTPASGSINPINSNMTVEQLKQDHPETYNAIFKAGVSSEKNRVSAWMAHADADLKTVKEGVSGTEEISAGTREELLIKSFAASQVKNLEQDSTKEIKTSESGNATEKSEDEKELEAFNASIDKML